MLTDVEAYRSHMAQLIGKSHPGEVAGGPSAQPEQFRGETNRIRGATNYFKTLFYGRPNLTPPGTKSVYEAMTRTGDATDPGPAVDMLLEFDKELQNTQWFRNLQKELQGMDKESDSLVVERDFKFADPSRDINLGLMCLRYLAGVRIKKKRWGSSINELAFYRGWLHMLLTGDLTVTDQAKRFFLNPALKDVMPKNSEGGMSGYKEARRRAKKK